MTNGEKDIADAGHRIAAAIVDLIIVCVIAAILIYMAISAFISGFFFLGFPFIAASSLLLVLYFMLFEAFMNGQTPGKMAVKIRVVKATGEPITFAESLIRNILRIVDYLPVLYLLGFIIMSTNDKRQRLGDIVANTIVINV